MAELDENRIPAIDDVPFEEEDLFIEEEEQDDFIATAPKKLQDMERGYAAVLKSYTENAPVVSSYASLQEEPDIQQAIEVLTGRKIDTDKREITEQFVQNPGSVEAEVRENAVITQEMMREVDSKSTAEHIVEAAAGGTADEEVKLKVTNRVAMLKDLQTIYDDMGWLEFFGDFGSLFIPSQQIKDNFDIVGKGFGAEDVLRQMIIGFKSLPAEKQREVWPRLKEEVFEAMPKIKGIPLLMNFLDPVGEEKLEDFNNFWAAFDVVDLGLIGFGISKRIASMVKNANAVKVLKQLENADDAADINAAAVADDTGEVAESIGIDKTTAVSNALPFNIENLDEATVAGLNTDIVARLNAVRRAQSQTTAELATKERLLTEDLLDPAQREAAEQEFVQRLSEQGFENVTPISRDKTGVTYSVDLKQPDGSVVKGHSKLNLTLDSRTDIWEMDKAAILKRYLTSSSVLFRGKDKADFRAAARLDSESPVIGNHLQTLVARALKPVVGRTGLKTLVPGFIKGSARQKLAEIEEVMLEADRLTQAGKLNRMPTVTELRSGVYNGISLSDDQIEAYYNLRGVFDSLYLIRNAEKRREKIFQGKKEIQLAKGKEVGKPYETREAAQGALNTHKPDTIWIPDQQTVKNTNDLDLVDMYDQGYVLARLDSRVKFPTTKELYDMVLIRKHKVKELPGQILHYKENYVPKINKRGFYFVNEIRSAVVNGKRVTDANKKLLRQFDNEKEAKEFADELRQKNPNVRYTVLEDREMERQAFGSTNLASGGGLYTGPRASQPVLFGKEGLPAERAGVYESLMRDVESVTKYASMNEWRLGMQQKWVNTAESMGVDVRNGYRSELPDTKKGIFLKHMRDQIDDWLHFPSRGERIWNTLTQEAMEWALGAEFFGKKPFKRGGVVVEGLHNLSQKDPIGSLRAATFHTMLGWGNPAQWWVQAQGASIAFAVASKFTDPAGALIALRNQTALQIAALTESEEALAKIAKSTRMDLGELKEMRQLWLKSGLQESILNTADHAVGLTGRGGVAMEAVRKAADKGLLFYRFGELFNRRTAFAVALREFKKSNKGVKIGDDQLKEILSRSNDLQLNMMRAGRSAIQKGLPGLSTQFMGVQFRMLESILGLNKQFSKIERGKILAAQVGLYGTAGVPLVNLGAQMVADWVGMNQKDLEEFSARHPEVVKGWNDGFWGWFALAMFGADVEVGTRGGILSGVEQMTSDILFNETPVMEAALGAFGQLPIRALNAYSKIKPIAAGVAANKTWADVDDALLALRHLASITTSWGNFEKAYFMHQYNKILTRNGITLVEKDFDLGTEAGQLLGFSPSDITKVRNLQLMNKSIQDYRKRVTDSVINNMHNYILTVDKDMTGVQRADLQLKHENITALLLQSLPTARDRQLVWDSVERRITSGKSMQEKEVLKFLENFNDGRLGDIDTLSGRMQSKGLIVTGVLEEAEEE